MKLYNRDGANLELKPIGKDLWILEVDDAHSYCLKYVRFILNKSGDGIEAIDPAGGPFISIGDRYENYKIVKIYSDLTIRMCEENNNK